MTLVVHLDAKTFPITLEQDCPVPAQDFEALCALNAVNGVIQLERTREGKITMNAPAGGPKGDASSEINRQLRNWWDTHNHSHGKVYNSCTAFTLPDTSTLSPDAAYVTTASYQAIPKAEREGFLPVAPAFIIELLSNPDHLREAQDKMQRWIENGVSLGWLIDPVQRSVSIYELQTPISIGTSSIAGTGPVEGFVLDLTQVWRCYDLSV